jgi:hypothetical protein
MKKWRGMNLEEPGYSFPKLGGQTSITMKVRKADPSSKKGSKSMGAFVARNGAGNPNTGTAYFNLSAILGYDGVFRPSARYEAGPRAAAAYKSLMQRMSTNNRDRLKNKSDILKQIAAGSPLKGYVKAGKTDGAVEIESIYVSRIRPNGAPAGNHPIIRALQASNPKPRAGTALTLARGKVGDALELAREYSVIMTLDAVLGQWDRYSGGAIYARNDDKGKAHFYAVDNDGSEVGESSSWTERSLGWFSRYDRKTIAQLKELYNFLEQPETGYLGYDNAEKFIVDLGLYFEYSPATYVARIKRNLNLLFRSVQASVAKHGDGAYLD